MTQTANSTLRSSPTTEAHVEDVTAADLHVRAHAVTSGAPTGLGGGDIELTARRAAADARFGHPSSTARRASRTTRTSCSPSPAHPRVVLPEPAGPLTSTMDTAIHFPPLPGGVSIEGVGKGGATAAAFDWITGADRVVYWGDMDADGLEILDGFRAAGVPAVSILMDQGAYDAWERFGTNVDKNGKPLDPRPPRPVPHLTDTERTLYHQLIAPSWTRHRRIEQERIPLSVALEQVRYR
jgi:hypothetical protein